MTSPSPECAVLLAHAAQHDLRRLADDVRRRIGRDIDRLGIEPRPVGVRKLQTVVDAYRIRVGDYRVIYMVDDAARRVTDIHVRHRSDAYRQPGERAGLDLGRMKLLDCDPENVASVKPVRARKQSRSTTLDMPGVSHAD